MAVKWVGQWFHLGPDSANGYPQGIYGMVNELYPHLVNETLDLQYEHGWACVRIIRSMHFTGSLTRLQHGGSFSASHLMLTKFHALGSDTW